MSFRPGTLLDGTESTAYREPSLPRSKLSNPENTPSARTLRMMEEHDGSFFEFAMAQSIEHAQFFLRYPLTPTDVIASTLSRLTLSPDKKISKR
ncbi:MAG: hypothetical protein Ct9H300mP13_4700 [Gammaproteobacteria bacterium]|nr:MAG: hypothetical protein Ct9H300mP13_4700 [Gammaproteobacteria bacterium]